MSNLKDKTNNELGLLMKQMEYEHESLKSKLINDFDKLVEIEDKFKEAAQIISDRLKTK